MGSDGVSNQEKFTDVIQFFWIPGFQINCRDPERLRSWKNVETPSLPTLRRCYPRSFAFYLGKPISSIPAFSPRRVCDLLLLFRERSAHFYFIILNSYFIYEP